MHPAPRPPVGDEAGVLQGLQVEREPRLAGLERVRQVADALLAAQELADDPEAGLVRQGVEERASRVRSAGRSSMRAGRRAAIPSIYQVFLICQGSSANSYPPIAAIDRGVSNERGGRFPATKARTSLSVSGQSPLSSLSSSGNGAGSIRQRRSDAARVQPEAPAAPAERMRNGLDPAGDDLAPLEAHAEATRRSGVGLRRLRADPRGRALANFSRPRRIRPRRTPRPAPCA